MNLKQEYHLMVQREAIRDYVRHLQNQIGWARYNGDGEAEAQLEEMLRASIEVLSQLTEELSRA